jgi:hypothetical protein
MNGIVPGSLKVNPLTEFCITNFGKNVSGDTNQNGLKQ